MANFILHQRGTKNIPFNVGDIFLRRGFIGESAQYWMVIRSNNPDGPGNLQEGWNLVNLETAAIYRSTDWENGRPRIGTISTERLLEIVSGEAWEFLGPCKLVIQSLTEDEIRHLAESKVDEGGVG